MTPTESKILATHRADPSLTASELATKVGCALGTVYRICGSFNLYPRRSYPCVTSGSLHVRLFPTKYPSPRLLAHIPTAALRAAKMDRDKVLKFRVEPGRIVIEKV